LSIDGNDLAAFEAGEKRINANLLFRIAKWWMYGRTTFFEVTPTNIRRR
jgi:hypothetical protein